MNLHINVIDEKVVVTFEASYSWLSLTSAGARDLGEKLITAAELALVQESMKKESDAGNQG